jgi:hypothetical protein
MRNIILGIFLLSSSLLFSQNKSLRTFDYSRVDSIALHLPKIKYSSYGELAALLTSNLNTEQEKFRAIYRWIADNIKYSHSRTSDASKVLRSKRAACIGYSSLLQQMCEAVNLQCETIEGWSKIDQKEIGQKMNVPSHAWNAINLGGKWYLTDVTWATSYFDVLRRRMVKYFDTSYFLPSPEEFIKQHYPKEQKWQLMDTVAKKKWFRKTYVWYNTLHSSGISIVSPLKGRLSQNPQKDFTMVFRLDNSNPRIDSIKDINFMMDNNIRQSYFFKTISIDSSGLVIVKWKFPKYLKGEHEITVFYNETEIAGYMLKFY